MMLQKAVLATVAYYDALDYPVTEFETWKHLIRPDELFQEKPTLGQVSRILQDLYMVSRLEMQHGFYILPGRRSLIPLRIRCEKYSARSLRRAVRLISRIQWIPFLRMVGITGSLSMKQADSESDWDLFVILRKGAIWRGRTFLTAFLHLIGKRRHGRYIKHRACLNHFITDGDLALSLQDLFSAHEYRFLYPIIGWETFQHFELANRWMMALKPTFSVTEIPTLWLDTQSVFSSRIQHWGEHLFNQNVWEQMLSRWQLKKIQNNPNSNQPESYIVANDRALIFLPHPKGPRVFDRFKERLAKLSFTL